MAGEEYIGKSGPDGMVIGLAVTDKIGFYGTTPIVQGTTGAAGTDAATVQTLVNLIKVYLDASGQMA